MYSFMHVYFCLQDDKDTADFALDGLKQVMAVKSRSVLPYLVPKVMHVLLKHPSLIYIYIRLFYRAKGESFMN